jgi:hypothetical protein
MRYMTTNTVVHSTGMLKCVHWVRYLCTQDFFTGATTLCGSWLPPWSSSIGSSPEPLFSILVHQGVWDLSLYNPATLRYVFQPSVCLRASNESVSYMEMFVSFSCPSHLSVLCTLLHIHTEYNRPLRLLVINNLLLIFVGDNTSCRYVHCLYIKFSSTPMTLHEGHVGTVKRLPKPVSLFLLCFLFLALLKAVWHCTYFVSMFFLHVGFGYWNILCHILFWHSEWLQLALRDFATDDDVILHGGISLHATDRSSIYV